MKRQGSRNSLVSASLIGADALASLDPLIEAYPFKAYRNYRVLSRKRQEDVLRAEVRAALEHAGGFGVVAAGDTPAAAALVRPLPWDSAFFEIPMARVFLVHDDEARRTMLLGIITSAIEACRARGIRHLSVRVDVGDAETIQALEDAGFRMMDALATYIYPLKRPAPEPGKDMGVLRLYQPEDRDQILEITREAYRGFRGRYHLDPHLPQDRSDELYVEWARKSCDGDWADVVLVTENGKGELHGWASYRQIEPVSTVGGTAIRGGGLGACRRDKPGAYAGLLRAATVRIHGGGAITEMQTQIFNFATIRLYEAVETQFVRADYTLHAWLGD
jgi:L-amino acid N-acyltransferase YncA